MSYLQQHKIPIQKLSYTNAFFMFAREHTLLANIIGLNLSSMLLGMLAHVEWSHSVKLLFPLSHKYLPENGFWHRFDIIGAIDFPIW